MKVKNIRCIEPPTLQFSDSRRLISRPEQACTKHYHAVPVVSIATAKFRERHCGGKVNLIHAGVTKGLIKLNIQDTVLAGILLTCRNSLWINNRFDYKSTMLHLSVLVRMNPENGDFWHGWPSVKKRSVVIWFLFKMDLSISWPNNRQRVMHQGGYDNKLLDDDGAGIRKSWRWWRRCCYLYVCLFWS